MSKRTVEEAPVLEKPWYWENSVDPVYPFYLWDSEFFKGNPSRIHWHRYIEFITVLEGRIDAYVNGKIYPLKKNDILIINPDMIHEYIYKTSHTHHICFLFGAEILDQSLADIRDKTNLTTIFAKKTLFMADIDGEHHRRLLENILSIADEFNKQKDGYRMAIRKHLYDIALLFLRDLPPVEAPLQKTAIEILHFEILERILTFIHNNYGNPDITLEQGAEVALLSRTYFSRFFRERTGLTFHAYLNRVRINQALELLSETDLPVTDIAQNTGFSSLTTFNRLFKNATGISPSQCRAELIGSFDRK